ncbi:hypothetical protein EDB80DRAFT_96149 [Ilyonectria destructans]|nr:hypothetical protein EDB80DRAFT_96149 [Ilyonectria destructans]
MVPGAHRPVPGQGRGELTSVLLDMLLTLRTSCMHALGVTQPTVNYGGESAVHCGDHSPSPPFRAIQGLERKCISVPMHCPKFDQAVRVGCRQPMYVQDAHTGPLCQVHLEHVAETWGVGHVPLDRRNHRLNITFSEYETVLFKSRKLVQPQNGYEGYTIDFSSSCKEGGYVTPKCLHELVVPSWRFQLPPSWSQGSPVCVDTTMHQR